MEQKKIYVVHNYKRAVAPLAVFDSKEKVMGFTNRFKQNKRYAVYEQDLNPSYIHDKDRSPYKVTFEYGGEVRIYNEGINEDAIVLASENGYEIDGNLLTCFVLATDPVDALHQSTTIKENLLADGDWEERDNSN